MYLLLLSKFHRLPDFLKNPFILLLWLFPLSNCLFLGGPEVLHETQGAPYRSLDCPDLHSYPWAIGVCNSDTSLTSHGLSVLVEKNRKVSESWGFLALSVSDFTKVSDSLAFPRCSNFCLLPPHINNDCQPSNCCDHSPCDPNAPSFTPASLAPFLFWGPSLFLTSFPLLTVTSLCSRNSHPSLV